MHILYNSVHLSTLHFEDDDGVEPEERASPATNLINESDDEDVVYRYSCEYFNPFQSLSMGIP